MISHFEEGIAADQAESILDDLKATAKASSDSDTYYAALAGLLSGHLVEILKDPHHRTRLIEKSEKSQS